MKKVINEKFLNENMAMMALMSAQTYFVSKGFSTYASIVPKIERMELVVHFDLPNFPTLPTGYVFTTKEYTSQEYFSEGLNAPSRVRSLTLTYRY